jgi:hypothetical protein
MGLKWAKIAAKWAEMGPELVKDRRAIIRKSLKNVFFFLLLLLRCLQCRVSQGVRMSSVVIASVQCQQCRVPTVESSVSPVSSVPVSECLSVRVSSVSKCPRVRVSQCQCQLCPSVKCRIVCSVPVSVSTVSQCQCQLCPVSE